MILGFHSFYFSKLYSSKGKETTKQNLGVINVGEHLQIKTHFYDECRNEITGFKTDELEVFLEQTIKNKIESYYYNYKILQNNRIY